MKLLRGPYCIADLKGYNHYFRFVAAEYNLRREPESGKCWAIDADLHERYKMEKRYNAYQEALLSLLSYDEVYDTATPLDILEKARFLKKSSFPDWWEEQVNLPPEPHCLHLSRSSARNRQNMVLQNALFPNTCGNVKVYGLEQWYPSLQTTKQILFLPDKRGNFLHDLMTWIIPFSKTHHVIIGLNDLESPYTVSLSFARACLDVLKADGKNIEFVTVPGLLGLHTSDLIDGVYARNGCIVSKGIWNYFSLFRHEVPFLFSIDNEESIARGLLQQAYSPKQPESLRAWVGYQTRSFPQNVILTGQDYAALSLEGFLEGRSPRPLFSFLEYKQQEIAGLHMFRQIKDSTQRLSQTMHHYSGFFTIQQGQVIQVDSPGDNRVYLQGVSFDPNEFRIVPMRHDSLMLTDMLNVQEPALLANFSYFFTNSLRMMYNMSVNAEESLEMVDFPFDYIGEWREGEFRETVPLYRKGYIGSWDDGRLFIGYLTLREASCEIQGRSLHIPLQAIDPGLQKDLTVDNDFSAADQPICLFTPAYPKRRVGQGRNNVVIINETIVHVGINKAVTIPPVGVVLSLYPEYVQRYFTQVSEGERVKWNISFEELLQKSRLRWLYGGYNILVLNGKNLVKTEEQAEQTLRKEGWYLPQSMRTQETQLLPDVRHPRIVIGTTDQGRILLLTISGRTQISCGATFTESALYCQHLLSNSGCRNLDCRDPDRLVNLINLDGGASVFLEARDAGKRVVLNFPAPTDLNPAGVIRPNSAFLKIVRDKPS